MKMKAMLPIIAVLLVLFSCSSQKLKKDAAIEINNVKLSEILDVATDVEILAKGFQWTEGPLWLPSENKLILSDIPTNSIFEWSEKRGKKLYLNPAGYTGNEERGGESGSNGLLLNAKNELVLCQHGDRRIVKMNAPHSNPEADFETLVDNFQGKKLNSPNDAVFHKNGDLYFTDPAYGLPLNIDDPAKELDFQGVFKVDKNGEVTLLISELSYPNGIAFSPDYSKLYVANSDPEKAIWMVYDLDENGLPGDGKLFFDATDKTKSLKGLPDGLKVHKNGWVFASGPGGILIFTAAGEHLGTIMTNEATSNCAFNPDFSELFITADDYLLRVKLKTE